MRAAAGDPAEDVRSAAHAALEALPLDAAAVLPQLDAVLEPVADGARRRSRGRPAEDGRTLQGGIPRADCILIAPSHEPASLPKPVLACMQTRARSFATLCDVWELTQIFWQEERLCRSAFPRWSYCSGRPPPAARRSWSPSSARCCAASSSTCGRREPMTRRRRLPSVTARRCRTLQMLLTRLMIQPTAVTGAAWTPSSTAASSWHRQVRQQWPLLRFCE